MAKKRIFISFPIEDANIRDFIVGQSKNEASPFEFVDMSVKEPWDNNWKEKCRTKIKGCDGTLVIISKNTKSASGQLWEIKCSREENIPCRGIWGYNNQKNENYIPNEMNGVRIMDWTWTNIENWINSL